MTLREFIQETVGQIICAVGESQKKHPFNVAPKLIGHSKGVFYLAGVENNYSPAFLVEFDVALTVSENKSTEGKGGISVAQVFDAGGSKSRQTEQSTVSRIKFSIPLRLQAP